MAKVHVCNVVVLDNPSHFNNPFQFEITFECIEDLPEDLEWKIIYVGSAESEEFDQVCIARKSFALLIMDCDVLLPGVRHSVCWTSPGRKAHVCISGEQFPFDECFNNDTKIMPPGQSTQPGENSRS